MKKLLSLLILMLMAVTGSEAQTIKVASFERNYTSLIASMNQVTDNTGEACAVIRFFASDTDFEIEPNLGVLKKEVLTGEIRLWVPKGTKRLTIRHQGVMPLIGYVIPVPIESKVTYEANLEIEERKTHASNFHFYLGAGYQPLSISGPSVALGLEWKRHQLEFGGIYGLNKTDDWYFYDSNGNVTSACNYQAIRLSVRYGYQIWLSKGLGIVPQAGAAFQSITGSAIENYSFGNKYNSASSISALVGLRLTAKLSEHFRLHVTPEYDFGVSKSDVCEMVSDNDETFKGWTDGVSVNVGVLVYF